ncbi:MAG: flagellar protein FlgN [Oligoflexia bacterium]|nr:flagellar protein FlgN [Oligoflexia bacterium]
MTPKSRQQGNHPILTRELKKLLQDECALYQEYLKLLDQERQLIKNLRRNEDTTQLGLLTAKRQIMTEEMQQSHVRRLDLLNELPEAQNYTLSQVISANFHPVELMELMPLVKKLRELMRASMQQGSEFNQVVNFASNFLNGMVSIISTASQSVVRCYNKLGGMREMYHPSTSRAERVLRKV